MSKIARLRGRTVLARDTMLTFQGQAFHVTLSISVPSDPTHVCKNFFFQNMQFIEMVAGCGVLNRDIFPRVQGTFGKTYQRSHEKINFYELHLSNALRLLSKFIIVCL